jgi:hypothetical protein
LAAAIASHADAIVTFTLKYFPANALEPHQIKNIHSDDYILDQLERHPCETLAAMKKMRTRLARPPQTAGRIH